VTAFWLKYQDPARMLRRVTQPPHIAGPLCGIASPKRQDFNTLENFLLTRKFYKFIGTKPSIKLILT